MDCNLPGSSVLGFSRQEYWSILPFSPPGIFPTQGWNPHLLHLLHWQAGNLTLVQTLSTLSQNSTLPFSLHSTAANCIHILLCVVNNLMLSHVDWLPPLIHLLCYYYEIMTFPKHISLPCSNPSLVPHCPVKHVEKKERTYKEIDNNNNFKSSRMSVHNKMTPEV